MGFLPQAPFGFLVSTSVAYEVLRVPQRDSFPLVFGCYGDRCLEKLGFFELFFRVTPMWGPMDEYSKHQ
jgi:hypothetical protein